MENRRAANLGIESMKKANKAGKPSKAKAPAAKGKRQVDPILDIMKNGSSRILVGKKPGCDVAMSHKFQWLSGVFKGLKTGHDFGHEKTA